MMRKLPFLLVAMFVSFITIQAQNWTQIGADINGEAGDDWSGWSVSLNSDGSIMAVGAVLNGGNGTEAGHVRVYQNIENTWTQIGADIDGEAAGNESGTSVSLSSDGSIVAIGAPANGGNGSKAGHVRVYKNIENTWTQIGADIDGEAAGDQSGVSVSLSSDGSIVAVGAFLNDGNGSNSGHVRIYENLSGTWTQIGADIDGEASGDQFGYSVSLSSDGSILAAGAIKNDGNGIDAGHVRIYENLSGTWTQIGADIDGEAANDQSGCSASLSSDGTIVAIGAADNDGNGANSGHARVYQNQGGTWTQVGADIDGEAQYDYSGYSVKLSSDGSIVAIGAPENAGNQPNAGHARIYQNQSGTWTQLGANINGDLEDDYFGSSVSLSEDGFTVAIGAIWGNGGAEDAGYVRVYRYSQLPTITSQPTNQTNICPNANASFTVEGTEISSYQWQVNEGSGFVNITDGGVYGNATTATLNITSVTLEMNNYQYLCNLTNTVGTIASNAAVLTLDDINPEISCIGNQSVTADQTHFYTVQGTEFDPTETTDNCEVATISNSVNETETLAGATLAEAENYTITWTVTDIAGNTNTCSFDVAVTAFVGTGTLQENEISIYPNPANDKFVVELSDWQKSTIELYNIQGQLLENTIAQSSTTTVDISNLAGGIYFVKIKNIKGAMIEKIIKN